MKTLTLCAAGALSLALVACNRQSEAPTIDAPQAQDAASTETGGAMSGSAGSSGSTTSGGGSSMTAPSAAADGAGSVASTPSPSDADTTGGPSQATRDGAKEKAEQTNLHP